MGRSVSMQFGRAGGAVQAGPGMKYITGGEVLDESVVTLGFEPGGLYVLYTKEYNVTTDAYRGHHAMLIAAPEDDVFGSVAVARGNMYGSTNTGVTVTNVADSTVTLARSAASYGFKYALYRVL